MGPASNLRIRGTSMWPVLWSGDRLIIEKNSSYRIGDVVVIYRQGLPIAHRVKSLRPGFVLTRGDAGWKDDPWAPIDSLQGRVVAVRRLGLRLPLLPVPLARLASFATRRFFGPAYAKHAQFRAWLSR
jgi:hypothetical protein